MITFRGSIRFLLILVFIYLFSMAFYEQVFADETVPDFLSQSQSGEQTLGKVFKDVFDWLLYAAIGLGALGAAYGLASLNGLVGKKEDGADKIKVGLGIVAVGVVFKGIVAFFANVAA